MQEKTEKKTQIRILSESTINKIAAGEVVERPISVVKELIENSIDANAKNINIIFRKGGRNLILVRDDGVGIEKKQIPIAFYRHATSKIDDDSLDNICHLGFRGEALAAISAVSFTHIVTRTANEKCGWKFIVNNFANDLKPEDKLMPSPSDFGTTIEVTDLFCFTPNRLKFLKSERSENMLCIDLVQRMAMSFFYINFSLQIDDKIPLQYISNNIDNIDISDNIDIINNRRRTRILDIMGKEFMDNSMPIYYEDNEITISGYAAIPTYSRFTAIKQKYYCYVNGRIVKDQFLTAIIKASYHGVLPHDRYPIVIIFITVKPDLVDVNVHPNKIQVRFWQESKIKDAVFKAIRKNMGKVGIGSNIRDDVVSRIQSKFQNNTQNSAQNNNRNLFTKHDLDNSLNSAFYKEFDTKTNEISNKYYDKVNNINNGDNKNNKGCKNEDNENEKNEEDEFIKNIHIIHNSEIHDKSNFHKINYNITYKDALNDNLHKDLGRALCQIAKTYIIAENKDGIIIVDQHATHERLVLEQIKQNIQEKNNGKPTIQLLLIPEIIELDLVSVEYLLEIKEQLLNVGIRIENIDDEDNSIENNHSKKIIVKEIPSIMGGFDIKKLLYDILNNNDFRNNIINNKLDEIYSSIACHSSIRAGRSMNLHEMNKLLRLIEITPFSSQCNHGRPTYVQLSLNDMNKIFERE